MRHIDVLFDGVDYRFRSNDDGSNLFVGDQNMQISYESGFDSLSRIKRYIKWYLRCKFKREKGFIDPPRLVYKPDTSMWRR